MSNRINLKAKAEIKLLFDSLSCMMIKKMKVGYCRIKEEGILFYLCEGQSSEAFLELKSDFFEDFEFTPDDPEDEYVGFQFDFHQFVELIKVHQKEGENSISYVVMKYPVNDGKFSLVINEDQIVTHVDLSVLHEDKDEGEYETSIGFDKHAVTGKVIANTSVIQDMIKDSCSRNSEVFVILSPNEPHFAFRARGENENIEIRLPKDSEAIEEFSVSSEGRFPYGDKILDDVAKGLRNLDKTTVLMNEKGTLQIRSYSYKIPGVEIVYSINAHLEDSDGEDSSDEEEARRFFDADDESDSSEEEDDEEEEEEGIVPNKDIEVTNFFDDM